MILDRPITGATFEPSMGKGFINLDPPFHSLLYSEAHQNLAGLVSNGPLMVLPVGIVHRRLRRSVLSALVPEDVTGLRIKNHLQLQYHLKVTFLE